MSILSNTFNHAVPTRSLEPWFEEILLVNLKVMVLRSQLLIKHEKTRCSQIIETYMTEYI